MNARPKVVEMIPQGMPKWAKKSMMEGTFFTDALARIERITRAARHKPTCPFWTWEWEYSWDESDCTCKGKDAA